MKINRYKLNYRYLAFEIYNNAKICTKCYSLENICVHHKDENRENNKENNLQILCKGCHNKTHKLGLKYSQETKNKISNSLKGKKHTKKRIKNFSKSRYKKVNQYTLDGEFIKTWNSIKHVIKILNINNIPACCKGNAKNSGGYKWKYFNNN